VALVCQLAAGVSSSHSHTLYESFAFFTHAALLGMLAAASWQALRGHLHMPYKHLYATVRCYMLLQVTVAV
jgi:hypothetical protein